MRRGEEQPTCVQTDPRKGERDWEKHTHCAGPRRGCVVPPPRAFLPSPSWAWGPGRLGPLAPAPRAVYLDYVITVANDPGPGRRGQVSATGAVPGIPPAPAAPGPSSRAARDRARRDRPLPRGRPGRAARRPGLRLLSRVRAAGATGRRRLSPARFDRARVPADGGPNVVAPVAALAANPEATHGPGHDRRRRVHTLLQSYVAVGDYARARSAPGRAAARDRVGPAPPRRVERGRADRRRRAAARPRRAFGPDRPRAPASVVVDYPYVGQAMRATRRDDRSTSGSRATRARTAPASCA